MQTQIVEQKTYVEEDDAWVVANTWELSYDEENSILHIYQVFYLENDEVQKMSIASQPYKTNPDGTTQEWAGAEDAFAWFENRKDNL